MAQKYLYEHGLPFSEDLKTDVLIPITKKLKRIPRVLIIDGTSGTGKTTLGVEIVDFINGEPMNLDPDECVQLARGGLELTEKAEQCKKGGYKVIIYDEASDLNRRGAMTRFNREMTTFFATYRSLGMLIIICVQNVHSLDVVNDLGLTVGLIHLHNPQEHYTNYMVYDLENLSYLLTFMDKNPRQRRKAYGKSKGYKRGRFLDLPPERAKLLEALSNTQKKKARKESRARLIKDAEEKQ